MQLTSTTSKEEAATTATATPARIVLSSSQIASPAFGSPPASVRVFQDALPSSMLGSIARANVMTTSRWMPLPSEPSTSFYLSSPFDAAIQRLRSLVLPSGARCMGVEWRIESSFEASSTAHDLHYTKDEELFALTGRIIHPLFSSVVYLTSGGGATSVVLENEKRIRIHPQANRFLVFPGHLMNGTATKVLRLNWWRSRPLNVRVGTLGEVIARPN